MADSPQKFWGSGRSPLYCPDMAKEASPDRKLLRWRSRLTEWQVRPGNSFKKIKDGDGSSAATFP